MPHGGPFRHRKTRKGVKSMAALGNNVKMAFLKGLEALGKGASNMATNAHQKLNEINLETRRRELLSEIPVRALDLWQQGEPMPQSLGEMLSELSALDEQLTVLRAQRYAHVEAENGVSENEEAAPEDEVIQEGESVMPQTGADTDSTGWESELDETSDNPDGLNATEPEKDSLHPDLRPVEPDPIDEGETGDNA